MSSPLDRAPGPDDQSPYAPKWARDGGQRRQAAPTSLERYFPGNNFEEPEQVAPFDERGSTERFLLPRSLDPIILPEPPSVLRRRSRLAPVGLLVLALFAVAAVAWFVAGTLPRSGPKVAPDSFSSRFAQPRLTPPVPHIVVAPSPTRPGEEPFALGVALDGAVKGAIVVLTGLPAGATLSSGRATGADTWQLSAGELDNALIRPPRGFAESMDILAELRLGDGTVVERHSLHFERTPAPQLPRWQAARQLDADELAMLIRRGEEFIATGDLAAARLMLQRAAEGGAARAALALAGTYDPNVLEQLRVKGFAPDVTLAQAWYERAKELGSAEAPRRLERLASRNQ
jgi:hypothetical protein